MSKKQRHSRRQVQIPSIYRYFVLGLLLPMMVIIGMLLGFRYGLSVSGFYAAVYAAIGSVVGLILATAIIVKTVLYWDKRMLASMKKRQGAKSTSGKSKGK